MNNTKRTFAEIAKEITKVWKNVNFAAKPYLAAMLTLNTTDKDAKYLFENADSIVRYFLANAATFKGEDARRIKTELKQLINYK